MMNSNGLKSGNLIDDMQETTKENTFNSCLISTERSNTKQEIKQKRVKFAGEVIFIDVECWKKFNAELTADENFDEINEEESKEEQNKNINKKNNKNNTNNIKNIQKDNIFCTCNII